MLAILWPILFNFLHSAAYHDHDVDTNAQYIKQKKKYVSHFLGKIQIRIKIRIRALKIDFCL